MSPYGGEEEDKVGAINRRWQKRREANKKSVGQRKGHGAGVVWPAKPKKINMIKNKNNYYK